MSDTLFSKYGGIETFSAVVSNFYQKVLDSENLASFFTGVDIEALMSHQTNFIAKALGGPDEYAGRDVSVAHANMGITEENFTEVAELLTEALEEAGVESDDVTTIIGVVASLKDQIVSD